MNIVNDKINDKDLFYMEFSKYVGEDTSTMMCCHSGDIKDHPVVKEVESLAKHFVHHKATKNPDMILFEEVTTRRYVNRAKITSYSYSRGYLYITFECDINGSYTYKFKKSKNQYEAFKADMIENYNLEPVD